MVWEGTDYKFIVKLSYLEVPVMFKYSLSNDQFKPYIMAGPSFGYNLSAKIEASGYGITDETDIKDEIKNIDFNLGFGAGVSIPMGNNSIFVEARYALGLTNINDDPDDPDTDINTKGIQIIAGIIFPLAGN